MAALQKPPIQFIWRLFLRKCVSMTTFVIRGEPAVKREERRCADEITFVEVASTAVPAGSRQSDPEGVGCQCRYRRHHRPTLLVREIARYTGRQPASPRSHSLDPRVENHGYHERIGTG